MPGTATHERGIEAAEQAGGKGRRAGGRCGGPLERAGIWLNDIYAGIFSGFR